jgi:hypothetical protein
MQILFATSIICFLVLVWAGIAVVRRIRASRESDRTSSLQRDDFAQHLFKVIEEENPIKSRTIPHQTFRDITARKSWNQPPGSITVHPGHELRAQFYQAATEPAPTKAPLPQSSHRMGSERLDWAYFNKDMGDLTDPYLTPSLRVRSRNSLKHK